MSNLEEQTKPKSRNFFKTKSDLWWIWDVLIVVILLIGAVFRFTGLNWDENYHLHPDERFLTMVESAIQPAENLTQYFDTGSSPLNPNNRGYTFYVYGTLPIFIVRYIGGWLGMTGYDEINLVGRAVSGAFDLGTILMVFLIGRKLYKNSKLGLLAALFSAMAVLQIQLSHYFTVDTVANFFAYAAIYTAVCIMMATPDAKAEPSEGEPGEKTESPWRWLYQESGHAGSYIAFGLLAGMALACKVSIAPLVFLLPLAAFIYLSKVEKVARFHETNLVIRNVVLAGLLAFVAFRFFQPYAFMGPGFFGLKLNPGWIASLKELSTISKGDVDVPYALQWARRPLTFAWENMVQWGLGVTLGVLAWFGFLWQGWRMLKGDWQKHLLVWGWVAFIFITQSLNWVRSMRYQLPVYPALGLLAAWTLFKLWENGSGAIKKVNSLNFNWRRVLAGFVAVVTVLGTALWAFAFTRIYTRPVTRVAASEWIYQNISAAFTLPIQTTDGNIFNQSLAYQSTARVSGDQPYLVGFTATTDGLLAQVNLEHVAFVSRPDQALPDANALFTLMVTVREADSAGGAQVAAGMIQSGFQQHSDARGDSAVLTINPGVRLKNNKDYILEISVLEAGIDLKLDGGVWLTFEDEGDSQRQYLPAPVFRLTAGTPYQVSFIPTQAGTLSEVEINRAVDLLNTTDDKVLTVTVSNPAKSEQALTTGRSVGDFRSKLDPRGEGVRLELKEPLTLDPGTLYMLTFSLEGDSGALGFYNEAPAIESTWDDALPLGMYNYNLFAYDTGLYGNIRNLELYFDDTPTKKDTIQTTLDLSDAIFISSNRQWGTTVRVDERYPLTREYYRALLGCPAGEDVLKCYQNAKPGMYTGELGFALTAVFQSDPTVAGIAINDQAAEEAFTVYDHPKVLIFEKTENYDSAAVSAILDAVDLSKAVHKTPRQASNFSSNLMLTDAQREVQTSGGTFSEIFPADWILNTSPWLAAVIWYLAIAFLGLIAYPIVRMAFGGLTDRGYPFSRLVGLILAAYLTWLASSTFFEFNRLTISVVLAVLVIVSGFLAFKQRKELTAEFNERARYFLTVELVMLVLFTLSLGIRYGNPDLWHPWKGGEKPMDLSYFTAVLKSTIFPPYDPWYAGGYINYYYYGFVLVGVPVKLLGIQPAVAYNLIIPTLFSLTGLGAFSVAWNLFARKSLQQETDEPGKKANTLRANLAGLISVFTVVIMGNLGTLRMFWQGLQRIVAPGGVIDNAGFFQRFGWFFQGMAKFFTGSRINYGLGDWYWNPSRALPGDTITEFPFFTFTYADLHAHMIALPVTLLVIGWGLSILLGKWKWQNAESIRPWVSFATHLFLGALAIGMLRATNTWDFPTYLLLSALVILYTVFRYVDLPEKWLPGKPAWLRKGLFAAGVITLLAAGVSLLFKPFTENFGQAYNAIDVWAGDRSPLASYLVHWGLQFFVIITWFVWETREWLSSTPVSSLKKIQPYLGYLQVVAVLFGLVLLLVTLLGVKIGWLAGILGGWALVLMLRPGQTDAKRLVLFLVGTGVVLTLFVEMFVLVGDIGRMNTVFKFYYQAWTFFSLSAAAAIVWLLPVITTRWKEAVSSVWQVALAVLVFSAAMYPITAATDKIRDRMSQETPATLDGFEFMKTSRYYDQNLDMDLSQDYHAIQWMQQNVTGSPVLVETNTVEYRWGNRFTIYTGLPGVLGWNWHQRQQRGFLDYNGIANRLTEIPQFYQSTDVESAREFLAKYNVKYIILGQMERAYYPGDGLVKFETYDGVYWREVFREADTVIYEVIE